MSPTKPLFEIERLDNSAIVTPLVNLSEFEFQEIEAEADEVLNLLGNGDVENVVMDFHKTDYYGSTALGFFVSLWKKVRLQKGNMAFCNVSPHEREILEVTKLDTLWSICSSREEALETVHTKNARIK